MQLIVNLFRQTKQQSTNLGCQKQNFDPATASPKICTNKATIENHLNHSSVVNNTKLQLRLVGNTNLKFSTITDFIKCFGHHASNLYNFNKIVIQHQPYFHFATEFNCQIRGLFKFLSFMETSLSLSSLQCRPRNLYFPRDCLSVYKWRLQEAAILPV